MKVKITKPTFVRLDKGIVDVDEYEYARLRSRGVCELVKEEVSKNEIKEVSTPEENLEIETKQKKTTKKKGKK